MRFITIMDRQFANMSVDNCRPSKQTVLNLQGGWEVWYQVQFALALLNEDSTAYRFEREERFPNSNQRCDFVIELTRVTDFRYWIELKVLLQGGTDDLAKRFIADVQKLEGVNLPEDSNTGGAVAVAPIQATAFINSLRLRISSGDQDAVSCIVYNERGVKGKYSLKDIGPIDDADSVFVYTQVF